MNRAREKEGFRAAAIRLLHVGIWITLFAAPVVAVVSTYVVTRRGWEILVLPVLLFWGIVNHIGVRVLFLDNPQMSRKVRVITLLLMFVLVLAVVTACYCAYTIAKYRMNAVLA